MGKATHVLFILDSSGSMSSIKSEAIELFNKEVANWQNAPEGVGRVTVSFATFGTDSRPVIHYVGESVDRLHKLTSDNYVPDGLTPMYDAVGMLCSRVEKELSDTDNDYAVLVIIVSDGQENYSGKWQLEARSDEKAWSSADLSALVKRLQATGKWTFTYLGANQNLAEISATLSIPKGNIQVWNNTSFGTKLASTRLESASVSYTACRSAGGQSVQDFYARNEAEQQLTDQQ